MGGGGDFPVVHALGVCPSILCFPLLWSLRRNLHAVISPPPFLSSSSFILVTPSRPPAPTSTPTPPPPPRVGSFVILVPSRAPSPHVGVNGADAGGEVGDLLFCRKRSASVCVGGRGHERGAVVPATGCGAPGEAPPSSMTSSSCSRSSSHFGSSTEHVAALCTKVTSMPERPPESQFAQSPPLVGKATKQTNERRRGQRQDSKRAPKGMSETLPRSPWDSRGPREHSRGGTSSGRCAHLADCLLLPSPDTHRIAKDAGERATSDRRAARKIASVCPGR